MRKNRKRLLAGLLCAVVLMADFAPVGVRVSAAEQEAGQSAESELWSETDDRGTEESAAETRIEESATEEKEDGTGTEASAVEEKEDETGTETSKEAETESESTVKSTETDTEDVETEDNSLTEIETEVEMESMELAEEEAPTSGTCGANLTWKLEDGTLTISGTGAMEDSSPWYDNRDKINKIVVGNGVTSIGNYAFKGCSSLTELTISNSVTYIGSYAFSDCSSLADITIPNSVTYIGSYAFSDCRGLTNITIPASVTSIGGNAFSGCNNLTAVYISSIESWCNIAFGNANGYDNYASNPMRYGANLYVNGNLTKDIIIPDSVTSIGNYTFNGYNSLTSITIPASVTSIGNLAFDSCSSLTSITIPDSVTSIGVRAFSDCSSLTSITIPASVTSINNSVFSGCSSLTSIAIPASVNSIDNYAFGGCSSLTEITIPDSVAKIGERAFGGCSSLTEITIPNSVTSIGILAFAGCSSLTEITIPNSVTRIDKDAFYGCSSLTGVYISSIESWCNIYFGYTSYSYIDRYPNNTSNPLRYAANLYVNGILVKDVIIPDGVTHIHGYAFAGCSSLTSITIPDSVTSIGDWAFAGCSSLTTITIPASVTSIGVRAFSGCSSLTNITFPDSVTNIEEHTFAGCISLTNITIPDGVTSIGQRAFVGCRSLTSITIPDSVTSIYEGAFEDCNNLTGVYISSIKSWCNISFAFPRRIGDDTCNPLYYGANLYVDGNLVKDIIIPNGVTSIGMYVFYKYSGLTSIAIPKSVTRINYHTFAGCSNLTDVYYSGSEDDWNAIDIDFGNEMLSAAKIHYNMSDDLSWNIDINGVLSIYGMREMADYNNSDFPAPWSSQRDKIKKVIIGQFVTSIGASAFAGCTNLTTITIPIAVKSIGDSAFSGCSSLAEVDYIGNKTQWGIITKGTDNAPLYNAKIHYRSSDAGSDTEPDTEPQLLKDVYYYDTIAEAGVKTDLTWNWNYLDKNPSKYNNNLAQMGLVLSAALEGSSDELAAILIGKDLDITKGLGCDRMEFYYNLSPGAAFAHRTITNTDGETEHVIFVVIRGTTTPMDVYTDVISAMGSEDWGTYDAYLYLQKYLSNLRAAHADMSMENTKFFITGHSLGGVCANLIARDLSDFYGKDHVYAYTFASPSPFSREVANNYTNIHNFLCWDDNVPTRFSTQYPWYGYGYYIWFYQNESPETEAGYRKLTGKSWQETYDDHSVLRLHAPSIYLAFFQSNPSFEPKKGKFHVYYMRAKCPVNIEVYNSVNELVGRITNEEVDLESRTSGVVLTAVDGLKSVYFAKDDTYTIRIIGTGEGTMTFTAGSADLNAGIMDEEKIFSNVQITEGKKMTSTVSVWDKTDTSIDTADKIDTKDVQLLVLDENGEPQKEVLPDGNGTEVPVGSVLDGVLPGDIPEGGIPEGLWIAGIKDYIYTGTAIKPEIRVYDNDNRLKAGQDYIISYKNNVNANNASNTKKAPTVTVRGKGNYTGTETATFKIQPVNLNDSSILAEDICTAYTGKAQKKIPVLTCHNKKLSNNKDFTVSYPSAAPDAYKAAGTYDILLTAKQGGNYTGTRTVKLTITDSILISRAKVEKIPAQPYTGAAIEPGLNVTCNKIPLTKDRDYTAVYTSNTDVGTAAVTITGIGSYAGTKTVTFKITGISLNKASVTGIENKIYSGTAHKQNLKVVSGNKTLAEGTDYEAFYTNNINAGKATVTIKGINLYAGSIKKTFRIAPCDIGTDTENLLAGLDAAVTEKYVKGGSRPHPQLTYAGRKLTEGKDYTITYRNNRAAASAEARNAPSFTIRGKGNFKGTLTRKFSITGKALDDPESPVRLSVLDKGYSGKAGGYVSIPVLTDTDGKKLTAGTDYEKEIQYTLEDGTPLTKTDKVETGRIIRVKVTGKGAYSGGLEGVYRITENDFSKAAVTISPQTYTGKAVTLGKDQVTVKIGKKTLAFGTDYEIVEGSYEDNVKKGTARVTIAGKGSYGGTKTVKFRIMSKKMAWFWRIFG